MKTFLSIAIPIAIIIAIVMLWIRQHKCSTGFYPWQDKPVGATYQKCSFWSGKAIKIDAPENAPENSSAPVSPATGTYNIIITKEGGAPIYKDVKGIFTLTGEVIPYDTKISGKLSVTASGAWYKTDKGWVKGNDVGSVDTQAPH